MMNSPAVNASVTALELARGEVGHGDDRALGKVAIALSDGDRVAMPGDELDPEREAPLADQSAKRFQRLVEGQLARRLDQPRRGRRRVGRLGEGGAVDQPVEQRRPPGQLLRQGRGVGEDQREGLAPARGRASSNRNRFTPLDRRSTMSPKRLSAWPGSAPAAITRSRPGSIASNAACAAGERNARALPERHSATWRAAASGSAKPEAAKLVAQDVGVVGRAPARRSGIEPVEQAARRLDMADATLFDQIRTAGQAVERGNIVERRLGRGQQVGLGIVDHLHAVLDRPQQAIGIGQAACRGGRQMPGRLQRGDRVERRRAPQRRIAAAVDHLLDLDEEFDLANAAAPALEIESRADMRVLREMVANPHRNLAHILDHPEIDRAAPHERLDRGRGSGARPPHRRPPPAPG